MLLFLLFAGLLGCAAPPPAPPSLEGLEPVQPPALAGDHFADRAAAIASHTFAGIAEVQVEKHWLRSPGDYLLGVARSVVGLTHVHPYYDYPYRVLALPTWVLFGWLDPFESRGSAFFVAPRLAITNAHVVANADRIRLVFPGGGAAAAVVVGADEERDLALLHCPEAERTPLPLRHTVPRPGEPVLAIGFPARDSEAPPVAGEGPAATVTGGLVSAIGIDIGNPDVRYLQTDVAANVGVSGAPLLDGHGCVLGVLALSSSEHRGEVYAIPVKSIREAFPRLGPLFPEEEAAAPGREKP